MKMIYFLYFLFKHGSLNNEIINFDRERNFVLRTLPVKKKRTTFYMWLRGKFLSNRKFNSIIGNIAYLKSVKKNQISFFIADTLKLGYLRILKSASTSILREVIPLIDQSLKEVELSDVEIDFLATNYATHSPFQKQKQYVFFTIIRNPFERLVSVYLDLFNPTNSYFAYESHLFGILKKSMTFSEFLFVLTRIPESLLAPHFVPQFRTIRNCKSVGKIHCFRLKKDSDLITDFLSTYNLTISHCNKNQLPYNYMSFYNPETLQQAYSVYKQDITEFDFKDEYEELLRYVNNET